MLDDGRFRGRLVAGLLVTGVAAAAGAICIAWIGRSKPGSELDGQEEVEGRRPTEDLQSNYEPEKSSQRHLNQLSAAKSLDSGISSLPTHRDLDRNHRDLRSESPPTPFVVSGNLSKDVEHQYNLSKQTEWTRAAKAKFCRELEQIIQEARSDELNYPISVVMIGDSICDLALSDCDLDLCLLTSGPLGKGALESVALIIHEALISMPKPPLCINPSTIRFYTPLSRRRTILVNLVVDDVCRIRISHLLSCYATADDRLAPLYCVIKLWAKKSGIMGRKGLTDNAIVYLLIHYLQFGCRPAVLPCLHTKYHMQFNNWSDIDSLLEFRPNNHMSANNDTLGTLLIGFMQYYSDFDFEEHVVSIKRARLIHRSESGCRDLMCIQAPFPSHKVNVAKRVVREEFLAKFRNSFSAGYSSLIENRDLTSFLK